MMKFWMFAAAFLSGAAMMSLEMAGFRIAQPVFGTDIAVWGGLISVFLGGMALGAWTGGRLADVRPAVWKLGAIMAATGALALIIPMYSQVTLEWALSWAQMGVPTEWSSVQTEGGGQVFQPPDLRWPALGGGALLFAAPAFLLGMVTPYAVKLLVRAMPRLGSGVGLVSGISTFGAIAGTLGTAFYLIAWLDTFDIFRLNGFLLLGFGAALILADFLAGRKCATLAQRRP